MNKDLIKQKISEALSASLGREIYNIEHEFGTLLAAFPDGISDEECFERMVVFIENNLSKEKEKRESEIKSALETIDWGDSSASENLGMNVCILYKNGNRETRNNVTEIHYNFPSVVSEEVGDRVAFESDVHGTGGTVRIDTIQEFEAVAAKKKEKEY